MDRGSDNLGALVRRIMAALGAANPAEWTDDETPLESALGCVATSGEIAATAVEAIRGRPTDPSMYHEALAWIQRLEKVAETIASWVDDHPAELARRQLLDAAVTGLRHDVLRLIDGLTRAVDDREAAEKAAWN